MEHTMRTLLLVMVLGLAVLGCGNGESADGSSAAGAQSDGIVGIWEVTAVLSGEDISNTGVIYEFWADGSMQSRSGALKIDGTYTLVGDTLRQVIGGIDMDALYSLDGDKLTYEIVNGTQIFLMERQ